MNEGATLRWITAGLAAAALYVCWPLAPALVLAAWTAAIARPLLVRFERGLNGRRRAAAALAMLLFLLVSLPLGLIVVGVVSGAQELWLVVAQSPSVKSALETIATESAGAPSGQLPTSLSAVVSLVQNYGTQGMSLLSTVAGAATSGLVGLLIYFGGVFVFLLDGAELWRWIERQALLAPQHLARFAAAFQETGRGLLIGVGLTSATQGLVATIIYLSLDVPRWWVLGPITGVASMIPMVGSALVWAPIAVGFFLLGHSVKAGILVVLGLAVIGSVDNVLNPIYARWGALKLPMLLLFVSIFGGLVAFGPWGAILGPLIVRLFTEALELRREGAGEAGGSATE
ncbi:MAG: AI-2E family transporter [Gemmatimonadetes bacterium]|nr:AI-2E family transporter [Gemmatimonadota bacterium]